MHLIGHNTHIVICAIRKLICLPRPSTSSARSSGVPQWVITAAASRVGLSQPAATAQVKSLETQLDRQLFVRHARWKAPTPAADDLARAVAAPLGGLAQLVDDDTNPCTRTVILGGPAELLTKVALPLLARSSRTGCAMWITLGLADDLLDAQSAGRLDLIVSTIRPRRRGIQAEPAFDETLVLVGAPGQSSDGPMIAYADDLPIIRRYWRSVYGMRPALSALSSSLTSPLCWRWFWRAPAFRSCRATSAPSTSMPGAGPPGRA
jgi:DNA-binding transcriptional LysR family regulator